MGPLAEHLSGSVSLLSPWRGKLEALQSSCPRNSPRPGRYGGWWVSIPAASLLGGDDSVLCCLRRWFPSKTELQVPGWSWLDDAPCICSLPPLFHCPASSASVSCGHRPGKPLAFKSLSQGLLLGEPKTITLKKAMVGRR